MKKLMIIIFLLLTAFVVMPEDIKTVKIARDAAVEKDGFKEVFLRNLNEQEEIYELMSIAALDDYIFVTAAKPAGIYKLDLQGKRIARSGRTGRGPGEFELGVHLKAYKNNLVFVELMVKLLFYNRELDFLKEIRLPIFSMGFIINNEGNFVFATSRISPSDKYFKVYSQEGKLLRTFGEKDPGYNPKKHSFDYVFSIAYDPLTDGIWAALGNCYDLLYYEKETLKAVIKGKKDYFKEYKEKDKKTGRVHTELTGRPIKIEVIKDRVFYFYKKDKKFYCDIFNKNNCKLLRRIMLERFYRRIAYHKNDTYYAIFQGLAGEEDHQLYRLELK